MTQWYDESTHGHGGVSKLNSVAMEVGRKDLSCMWVMPIYVDPSPLQDSASSYLACLSSTSKSMAAILVLFAVVFVLVPAVHVVGDEIGSKLHPKSNLN